MAKLEETIAVLYTRLQMTVTLVLDYAESLAKVKAIIVLSIGLDNTEK